MTKRTQSYWLSKNRKERWEKRLRQLAQMRAAKERKRLENPPQHEPKMQRTTCLQIGFRDEISGAECWLPLKSARDAYRRISVLLANYSPGFPQ
ncbi:MAG: hypothetical protein RLY20_1283 [Verrucomicrobiota bacterium]|jgi:hypothetical protein